MAGKAKAAKKMMRGGVAKKKMRGGGMAKMAQKKMMRGGMVKKKMMRGGVAKKKMAVGGTLGKPGQARRKKPGRGYTQPAFMPVGSPGSIKPPRKKPGRKTGTPAAGHGNYKVMPAKGRGRRKRRPVLF